MERKCEGSLPPNKIRGWGGISKVELKLQAGWWIRTNLLTSLMFCLDTIAALWWGCNRWKLYRGDTTIKNGLYLRWKPNMSISDGDILEIMLYVSIFGNGRMSGGYKCLGTRGCMTCFQGFKGHVGFETKVLTLRISHFFQVLEGWQEQSR